jgi:hypothetical protein
MSPLMRALNKTVLYGIVVDVIGVSNKIVLVSYPVFPKSPLPDSAFTMHPSGLRYFCLTSAAGNPKFRKFFFDTGPSSREILVTFRQFPYTMQVVGQQHNCVHFEGIFQLDLSDGIV